MNLYTNIIPFDLGGIGDNRVIVPVGSTFGLIGVCSHALILKTPKNSLNIVDTPVSPDIFNLAFKEVGMEE
jgi:hypothetical protein